MHTHICNLPLYSFRMDIFLVRHGQVLDDVIMTVDSSNFSDKYHTEMHPLDNDVLLPNGRRVCKEEETVSYNC